MRNYNIYQGDSFITVSAENRQMNEFGQTILSIEEDGIFVATAIVPKENLIVRTQDYTEYQSKLQEIIEDLRIVGFNDIERRLPNFEEYKQSMEMKRQSLLSYFVEKLNEVK